MLPGKRLAALVVGVVGGLCAQGLRHRGVVPLDPQVAARRQLRDPLPVCVEPFLRRRMAREQAGEPAAVLAVVHPHEGFLQADGAIGVIAGTTHVVDAVLVGLELGFAAVTLHQQLRRDARARRVDAAVVAVAGRDLRRDQPALQQHAAAHLLRRMPRRGVHDFMTQHGRKLGFGLQLGQQTAIDADLAAGQCPGVRDRVVQHREFIRQLAVADGGEPLPDLLHVARQPGIHHVVAALGLAHRREILLADLDLGALADQHQLVLARNRVRGAGRQQDRSSDEVRNASREVVHVSNASCQRPRPAEPCRESARRPTVAPSAGNAICE